MKKQKKLTGVLLVLALSLALLLSPIAATATEGGGGTGYSGKIVINSATEGQTYSIYKLFDLTINTSTGGATSYSYQYNDSAWDGFFKASGSVTDPAGAAYVDIDTQGYVTWIADKTQEKATEFAQKAMIYAKANNIAATAAETVSTGNSSVTFENLQLGYYLVDTSLGTLCILTSTAPEATVTAKQFQPRIEKKVCEDSTGNWGDWNDADIGQNVEFQVEITAKAGAENYLLHDQMADGLTFEPDSVAISLKKTTGFAGDGTTPVYADATTVPQSGNYTVLVAGSGSGTSPADDCTFAIKFSDTFCAGLADDDKIIVSYKAMLGSNAVIAGDGNENKSWLTFGDEKTENGVTTYSGKTAADSTYTYTWKFDVLKTNDLNTALAGAMFTLNTKQTEADGTETYVPITFAAVAQAASPEGEPAAQSTSYPIYHRDTSGSVSEITTDATGHFILQGLDEGYYYLIETAAPNGYRKLESPITIHITSVDESSGAGAGTGISPRINDTTSQTGVSNLMNVTVVNYIGSDMPTTGGMGTTIIYIAGAVLALGAGVLLVARRRMGRNG